MGGVGEGDLDGEEDGRLVEGNSQWNDEDELEENSEKERSDNEEEIADDHRLGTLPTKQTNGCLQLKMISLTCAFLQVWPSGRAVCRKRGRLPHTTTQQRQQIST